jgi:glycosyltransferase involved in cell wall biosynthesis
MISIIVVTYNRKHLLKKCLDSLLSQKINSDYEIIVIDNGSCDKTTSFIKNNFPDRVKLIPLRQRTNLRTCKNLGINNSRGEVIAFTDDDCRPSQNWLKNIKNTLKNYDFIGGAVKPGKKINFPWWWQPSLSWLIGLQDKVNHKLLPLGSNVAYRDYVLKPVREIPIRGSFSPLIAEYSQYGEDIDRAAKALENNFKMGFSKKAIVFHSIDQSKLKITYLIKRSYREGYFLAKINRKYKNICQKFLTVIINPIRFLVTFQLTFLFKTILSFGYFIGMLTR